MSGYGSVKDRDGYIVRVSAGDPKQLAIFIQGGANGVSRGHERQRPLGAVVPRFCGIQVKEIHRPSYCFSSP